MLTSCGPYWQSSDWPNFSCEMWNGLFFLVNCDFISSRELWLFKIILNKTRKKYLIHCEQSVIIFDRVFYYKLFIISTIMNNTMTVIEQSSFLYLNFVLLVFGDICSHLLFVANSLWFWWGLLFIIFDNKYLT